MQAPRGVRENALHNYLVSMLNIYGIGLLLFAPIVTKLLWNSRGSLIFFIPYLVHIFFHNSGPFFNDNVIWFVIAAVAATGQDREEAPTAPRELIGSQTLRSRPMSPAYRN